jgi:GNAT superfamily N-acetyltransferase
MIETTIFNASSQPTELEKQEMVDFLFENLAEYGDPKKDIQKAIDFSTKVISSFGGFTMLIKKDNTLVGATVINATGMGGYIPENILVYIATHQEYRGQGLGKLLMQNAIEYSKGDIALHVEANNPAIHLYKKLGFTNPYLEMRLKK